MSARFVHVAGLISFCFNVSQRQHYTVAVVSLYFSLHPLLFHLGIFLMLIRDTFDFFLTLFLIYSRT